jgi:hypothetical protein
MKKRILLEREVEILHTNNFENNTNNSLSWSKFNNLPDNTLGKEIYKYNLNLIIHTILK